MKKQNNSQTQKTLTEPQQKPLDIRYKVLISALILIAISVGVGINIKKQLDVDKSKLPKKVELSKPFQRWITNLKNKELTIEADEFRYVEDTEIYNTKWTKIRSIEEPGVKDEFDATIAQAKTQENARVVFSPSDREFIDYKNATRGDYNANEAHFYGIRDDKLINSRILKCYSENNCFFDRAYFLDNDVFVISEVSLKERNKVAPNSDSQAKDQESKDRAKEVVLTSANGKRTYSIAAPSQICQLNQQCAYTFKVHLIDIVNNKRVTYESKPKSFVLTDFVWEL